MEQRPTTNMSNEQWDSDQHYLAGAIDAEGCQVVMLGTHENNIYVCDIDQLKYEYEPVLENPVNLTPNGKRYELREITYT